MRNRLSKTLAFILALAMIIAIMPIYNIHSMALSLNDYQSKYKAFINDSRWSNGVSWGYYQSSKLSSWDSIGCCAYAADFEYYVYGTTGWKGTAFYDPNSISSGNILYIITPNGGGHWIVVLERNGTTLYTAEGNYASKVNIVNTFYRIYNGKLQQKGYYNSSDQWVSSWTDCTLSKGYQYSITSHTHSYGSWQVVTAATCTTAGSQKRVCSCGDTQTQTIPATGHSWDAGIVETSADCTSEGVKKYTCTKCNTTRTEAISATGHTPVIDTAVAATCTETGLTEGLHCSVCNAIITKQETVPALGHDYKLLSYKKGCESVTATYKCDRCSETKTETKSDYILSDWLEEKPENVDESLITEKTQYSYSDKETTTSTESEISGWINDEAKMTWSGYGEWSNWQNTPVYENEYRWVQTRQIAAVTHVEYNYSRYVDSTKKWVGPSEGTWNGYYCGTYQERGWSRSNITNVDTSQGFAIYYESSNSAWFNQSTRTVTDSAAYTQYRYCDRHKIYSFYRWSDYSDWSDEEIEETENRQVKTRTVYQYKIAPTGHSFSSDWQTDSKSHWHVCTECGEAIDVAAHTYDNDKDTTCNECGYVREIAVESETKITVDSKKAMTGKEFTVSVDLTKNPGMAYLKLEMDYDSDVFEFISAKNLNVLSGTYTTSKTTDTKPYILQWMGAENSTESGNIAELTFKVKENAAVGNYTISINALEAYNEQYEDVEIETHDGIIAVSNVLAGDFNGDDVINGKDGILCSQILAGWDVEYEELAADLNGDGVFNGKDGILLSQYLAGWDVVLG